MGFSDLLTSSRGPGVIGTLLALLVLVGFGTLYLFAFDKELGGGKKTIAAVIRDQGMEIDSLHIEIQNKEQQIADRELAKTKAKEASELSSRNDVLVKQIAELTASQAAADEAVKQAQANWEKYKDEYRKSEWAAAVGEKLPDFTTPAGVVFTKVEIKSVSHTGVKISHSNGVGEIEPKDLPPELFDRFQFDMAANQAIKAAEIAARDTHITNVEYTTLDENRAAKNAQAADLEQQNFFLAAEVKKATDGILLNQQAIANQKAAIQGEKIKNISHAPEMAARLKAMEVAAEKNKNSIPENKKKISDNEKKIKDLKKEVKDINEKMKKIEADYKAKNEGQTSAPQK
ncbi:hypothetical protein [Luteolibacter soli]|uniref:Uncharacterized protein n=1 Tax=Luteolibacter soli TaxID=3135280 RepID=A0ABU9AYJ2_9BACT